MTQTEYDKETRRLTRLVNKENSAKKNPKKTLAEKIVHYRQCNVYKEQLFQHRLNYFNLVDLV